MKLRDLFGQLTAARLGCSFIQGDTGKKTDAVAGRHKSSPEGNSVKDFHDRLRDLCPHHGEVFGGDRTQRAADEAKQAHALADELQFLRVSEQTFEEFRGSEPQLTLGSEHLVEFDDETGRVVKLTAPPKFGLVPAVVSSARANIRDDPAVPATKEQVEFVHATPVLAIDALPRNCYVNDGLLLPFDVILCRPRRAAR